MNAKQLAIAAAAATSLLVVGLVFARNNSGPEPSTLPKLPLPAAAVRTSGIENLFAAAQEVGRKPNYRAWQVAINHLTANELPDLFARLDDLPATDDRVNLRKLAATAWAELDPAAAAAAVAALPPGEERTATSGGVLLQWLCSAPGDALAWADRQPDLSLADWQIELVIEDTPGPTAADILATLEKSAPVRFAGKLRETAFARLAETDPSAAVAFAQRQAAGPARDDLLTKALTALAQKDPTAALARATELPISKRQSVLAAATAATAARDPLDALAFLEQLPAGAARLEAAKAVVAGLAREDPDAAVEFASTFPAGRMRETLLSNAVSALVATDAPAALRWLQSLPEDATRQTLISEVAWQLVRSDSIPPSAAAGFALTLPPGYQRAGAFATAVERMAKQGVTATAAWLQTVTDAEVRPAALRSLAQTWSQTDITSAFTYAQRLTSDNDRQMFLSSAGEALAEQSTEAASYLALLPSGPARDAFAQGIVDRKWNRAPEEAATIVDAMTVGKERSAASANVARSWARGNPTTAAAWVESRPDLATDGETCAAVVEGWLQWDPDGAANWVARLPAGAGRAGAAVELVDEMKSSAPATAARWTYEIADPEQRHRAIARVAAPWLAADRATASAWLARTDLPRETQQALLEGRSVPDAEEEVIVLSPFEVTRSY